MYNSCITHVFRVKIGNSKIGKTVKYISNTYKIHAEYMRFPLPNPISHVFLMYLIKNSCIFRLRQMARFTHVFLMYFSCIFHVFLCIYNL